MSELAWGLEEVESAVRTIAGSSPVHWREIIEGGYSGNRRWVATWADGRTAFVKADLASAEWIGREQRVYAHSQEWFLPELLGFVPADQDAGRPAVLVIEDLSDARWGTPITVADAELLAAALDGVTAMSPPAGLSAVEADQSWPELAERSDALRSCGLFDQGWLDRYLPDLVAASEGVRLDGGHLVHDDIFLQNWCRATRGAVIVDWAGAALGNAELTRAWAEAGVRAADGPAGVVMVGSHPGWSAWISGLFVHYLTEVAPWARPSRLIETQKREAHAALAWACEELDLPMPRGREDFHPGPWRP